MRIDGKVVLITGASEGIGAACAAAFRERGARLALTARSQENLKHVGGQDALIVPGDITDANTREYIVNRILERYGLIDILVNNAGVGLYAPATTAPMEEARTLFEVNFFAPLSMIQHVVPLMRQKHGGSIVNIGSIAGKIPLPWFNLYSASKYALGALTDGLRMELKQDGIHVMLVCPGYVKTGFQEHVLAGRPSDKLAQKRKFAITPERCAEAIVRGVESGSRTVVVPKIGWLLIALQRAFPSIVEPQLMKMYERNDSAV
jgi:short-subunit dehydrogenase